MANKGSICIVDDDVSSLSMMRVILMSMGYVTIEAFNDARDAWSYIRRSPPNLVISDWNMDPVDGLELLTLVRNEQSTKPIPFLMVTANNSEDYWKSAIKEGVTEFLFKPYTLSAFRAAVGISLNLTATDAPSAAIHRRTPDEICKIVDVSFRQLAEA